MPLPYDASMPRDVELAGNYTVRLTALNPADGSVLAGITVASMVAVVVTLAGQLPSADGFTVTPLLTYTPGVT